MEKLTCKVNYLKGPLSISILNVKFKTFSKSTKCRIMHLNNKAKEQNTFDAIVVGSGISGGWAAKELCEKGLKVLLLERGRPMEHPHYPTATMNPWDFQHRMKLSREDLKTHPVQSRHYSFREDNKHFYIN